MGLCSSTEAVGDSSVGSQNRVAAKGKKDAHRRSLTMAEAEKLIMSLQPGQFDRLYIMEKDVLGKGGFGTVHKAERTRHCDAVEQTNVQGSGRHLKPDRGRFCAVKCISKTQPQSADDMSSLQEREIHRREQFIREVRIANEVSDFPSTVDLHAAFEDDNNFYMVMELCNGGELFELLCEEEAMTEVRASSYFRQILETVNHFHARQIAHRDLKPRNLVFSENRQTLKLIDFGLAMHVPPDKFYKDGCVGTCAYMAPEILKMNRKFFLAANLLSSDMWALGVILFCMLQGRPPFSGADNAAVFRNILREPVRFDPAVELSGSVKELILALLEKDPGQRLSCEAALSHPWTQSKTASSMPLSKDLFSRLHDMLHQSPLRKAALNVLQQKFASLERMRAAGTDAGTAVMAATSTHNSLPKQFESKYSLALPSEQHAAQRTTTQVRFLFGHDEFMQLLDRCGGKVAPEQMIDNLVSHGVSQEEAKREVKEVMEHADLNDDGFITASEYALSHQALTRQQLEITFAYFDHDGDGKISREELLHAGFKTAHVDELLSTSSHRGYMTTADFARLVQFPASLKSARRLHYKSQSAQSLTMSQSQFLAEQARLHDAERSSTNRSRSREASADPDGPNATRVGHSYPVQAADVELRVNDRTVDDDAYDPSGQPGLSSDDPPVSGRGVTDSSDMPPALSADDVRVQDNASRSTSQPPGLSADDIRASSPV